MQNNSSVFQIPMTAKRETFAFEEAKEDLEIYQELSRIAEEIEECRLRNS